MTLTDRTTAPNMLRAFEAVYLLNLPERTDRLRESLAVLDQLDPDARGLVEIVPGVRPSDALGFPSVGALGCFQAHLGALRQAQARGVQSLLVLEDDLRLTHDLTAAWPGVAASMLAQPWDMVSLGFSEPALPSEGTIAPPGVALFRTTAPIGLSHCYAMQADGIARMIEYFELILTRTAGDPHGGPMHHDGAMYHFFLEYPDRIRLRPPVSLVAQRSSRSDIAGVRWFDVDVPVVRSVVGGLRGLRNRLRG